VPMHSAIDIGHGMTNWPSNMLEIKHTGEHFVAAGLTVANYSAPWDSSVRPLSLLATIWSCWGHGARQPAQAEVH
jgi:hypothetical protein